MSIVCNWQGALPPIQCPPDKLPVAASYTLTEIACQFIFNAPLTPGSGGTLQKALTTYEMADRDNWFSRSGPSWLIAPLQHIIDGTDPQPNPALSSAGPDEIKTEFLGAKNWLARTGSTPREALEYIKRNVEQRKVELVSIAAKTAHFYQLLTTLLVENEIDIIGIALRDNIQLASGDDRADHEIVPDRFMSDSPRIIHTLIENKLEHEESPAALTTNEALKLALRPRQSGLNTGRVTYESVRISHRDALKLRHRLQDKRPARPATGRAKHQCRDRIEAMFRASPEEKKATREQVWEKLQPKIPNLSWTTFKSQWTELTADYPAWRRPGPIKKDQSGVDRSAK